MTEFARISIVSTAETALKKLKNAKIGVYNCKKDGARFIFSIKSKDVKKVFAIFSKPCYNISMQASRQKRLLNLALNRIGLLAGALMFLIITAVSNLFIFRIEVGGSGSYLGTEVRRIIYEAGFSEFQAFRKFDAPSATGKILSLPSVTFCNIEKRGSTLYIDVEVDEVHGGRVSYKPLLSDRDGTVRNVIVVCGTPAVENGSKVYKGDTLIYPYTVLNEEKVDCVAVGYVELECKGVYEYCTESESEIALKSAYAQANLYAENITNRTHTVKPVENGVAYVIEFTYLQKLSINME